VTDPQIRRENNTEKNIMLILFFTANLNYS
jgi:hypothetical protein